MKWVIVNEGLSEKMTSENDLKEVGGPWEDLGEGTPRRKEQRRQRP